MDVAIGVIEWGKYLGPEAIEQGVDVCVSSWRRMAPDTFAAMAKIGGNYVNSQLMVDRGQAERGFDEAIALDVAGYVSEGPGENIFLVWRNVIYTPPLGASILTGITRDCAITIARELGYEVREQMIPREMLYLADEVFFTGTAAEISPIRSVDRIQVGAGHRGPVTKAMQDAVLRPDRRHHARPSRLVHHGLGRQARSARRPPCSARGPRHVRWR